MFHAVPSFGRMIDGVSFHGYGDDPALPLARGSMYADETGGWAFARVDTARHLMLSHGVSAPFWLTEVGWSTNAVTPYAQARNFRDLITQLRSRSWIRALFIYNLRDHQPSKSDRRIRARGISRCPSKASVARLARGFESAGLIT